MVPERPRGSRVWSMQARTRRAQDPRAAEPSPAPEHLGSARGLLSCPLHHIEEGTKALRGQVTCRAEVRTQAHTLPAPNDACSVDCPCPWPLSLSKEL